MLAYDARIPRRDPESGEILTIWNGYTTKPHPITGKDVPDESARRALFDYTNPRRAEWPQADFIVGNPPFIGASRMREALGDGYTESLRKAWKGDVPESADFVMFWWQKAAELVRDSKAKRFGFITTNSIHQTFNRRVIEPFLADAKKPLHLAYAIPDHPWIDSADGAAVRIAMTVAAPGHADGILAKVIAEQAREDGENEVSLSRSGGVLTANLQIGADVNSSVALTANSKLSHRGVQIIGSGFIVTKDRASELGLGKLPGVENLIRGYLRSYTTALKRTDFHLTYIDAFAGAGRNLVEEAKEDSLFDDEMIAEDSQYRHGSPLIALENDPPFGSFIFIDQNEASIKTLADQVANTSPAREGRIKFLCGDANEQLQGLTARNWKGDRAVAFLDPFALHVSWETIEKIARTHAIDMWLLFPAMAVNRMLTRSGEIPDAWATKLTNTFGCDDWKNFFYRPQEPDLFGKTVVSKTPEIFNNLSEYITKRLHSVFAGVHKKPLILRNSTGAPLFLLCFACGNPNGADIATRIAQHIINKKSHGH